MKIELELPHEIGKELYWMYKEKIVKTKIVEYSCWNIGTDNVLRVKMARPNETNTIFNELIELKKVFLIKEELVNSISE